MSLVIYAKKWISTVPQFRKCVVPGSKTGIENEEFVCVYFLIWLRTIFVSESPRSQLNMGFLLKYLVVSVT